MTGETIKLVGFLAAVIFMKAVFFIYFLASYDGFIEVFKKAYIGIFSSERELYYPFSAGMFRYPQHAAGVISPERKILVILRSGDVRKILDSVIESVSISMAYFFFRHSFMVKKPYYPMHQHFSAIYGSLKIPRFPWFSVFVSDLSAYFSSVTGHYPPVEFSRIRGISEKLSRSFESDFNFFHRSEVYQ